MLKNKNIYKLVIIAVSISASFCLSVDISNAETYVYPEDIKEETVWNEIGSPYILEDNIYVSEGQKLTIGSGVEVISTTTSSEAYTLTFEGKLKVLGTKENPVVFKDFSTVYFVNSDSDISYAVFDKVGLDFLNSTSTIRNSVISDTLTAIKAKSSTIEISSSTIRDNFLGISSEVFFPFYQVKALGPNMGGIGNALIAQLDNPNSESNFGLRQNLIRINNSRIIGNKGRSIINQVSNTIDAKHNWWGRKEGPQPTETFGFVDVDPWEVKDIDSLENTCCSNVVFIPGFEGSRLYKDSKGSIGTSTNTLWEPNRNADVEKLYMDSQGKSIDSTIYTKDLLDTAYYGAKPIYFSFINSMNSLVSRNVINNWLPIPYDWRKGVYDVVDDDFIESIYNLASTSNTRKVTIIAHSNGGLVAKEVMKRLEARGDSSIVDNIIFIAVPELGTPESLLGMLHGHDLSIGFGKVMSGNTARTFSQNLGGAYGLLPSKKLFEKIINPVITNTFLGSTTISTFDGMKDFLLNNIFSENSSTNLNIPLKLNPYLMSLSETFHDHIDIWKPGTSTKTLSILGWGMQTSEGLSYEKDSHCKLKNISCLPIYTAKSISDGDGTVITDSNSGNANKSLFFDLKTLERDTSKKIKHADILESKALLSKIEDTITQTDTGDKSYDKYFSSTKPIDTDKYLTIKVHSPVSIDIYDKQGRHEGLVYNAQLDTYLVDDDNTIPGGLYTEYGSTKFLKVPYDTDYQISLSGTDSGVFSVDMDISQYDKVISKTSFGQLPVTPLMNIDLVIATSVESFATSSIMNIDVDGDNVTDLVNRTDTYLQASSTDMIKDMSVYIESMRKVIVSLKLPALAERRWLNRIDKIDKAVGKKQERKVERITKKLLGSRFKTKKITESQKSAILSTFESLLSYIENKN